MRTTHTMKRTIAAALKRFRVSRSALLGAVQICAGTRPCRHISMS